MNGVKDEEEEDSGEGVLDGRSSGGKWRRRQGSKAEWKEEGREIGRKDE